MKTIIIDKSYIDQFNFFLNQLTNFEKNTHLWNYILNSLKNNDPGVAVVCQFDNNEIIGFGFGYTLNSYWNRENALPYWIMGRHQKLPNKNLNFDIESIPIALTAYFEEKKYQSFYMVNKLSTNKINFSNCERLYQKFIRRAFNIERYNFSIEQIFHSDFDYDQLSKFYKVMCYRYCHPNESIVISKYDLKYQYRV